METINGVKNWASILDENTLRQAEMLSRSTIIYGHVALMPDAHFGMGATVGSVIATKGGIIPAAVGVDIGCGMIAIETNLVRSDLPEDLGPLLKSISKAIPAGFKDGNWTNNNSDYKELVERYEYWEQHNQPSDRHNQMKDKYGSIRERAIYQCGTLGSGNHFVELGLDEQDVIWAVVHSGSRGPGNKIAIYHINIAKEECKESGIELENKDLAHLTEGTDSFDNYIEDLMWAQSFAMYNRTQMMSRVEECISDFENTNQFSVSSKINCHHNFTQFENHYGEDVWLTRKGAIKAGINDLGIVPGSMATGIFITTGKGNPESYNSSAHGAGRIKSRGQAKRELKLDGVDGLYPLMEGIEWNSYHAKSFLDEHPLAYKDIQQVMIDQSDLTMPVSFIKPILNYKGN